VCGTLRRLAIVLGIGRSAQHPALPRFGTVAGPGIDPIPPATRPLR